MLKVYSNVLPIEFQIFLVVLFESFLFPSFFSDLFFLPFLSFPLLFPRYFSDLFFVLNGNVFFAFKLNPQNLFSVWSSLWFFSSCLQFWLTRKIPSGEIDPWKIQSILQTLTYALRKPLRFSTTTERNRPLVVSETFTSYSVSFVSDLPELLFINLRLKMKMSRNLWFANFSVCIRPEPRIAARFCGFFEV